MGSLAEATVAEALVADGWVLLARNWLGKAGELDLVVARGGALRFVEVKARAPDDPVGLEAIGEHKRRCLRRTAEEYLAQYEDLFDEACFMVALVEGPRITWIDDAFDG